MVPGVDIHAELREQILAGPYLSNADVVAFLNRLHMPLTEAVLAAAEAGAPEAAARLAAAGAHPQAKAYTGFYARLVQSLA